MEDKMYLVVLAIRLAIFLGHGYSWSPHAAMAMSPESFASYQVYGSGQFPIMFPRNIPTLPIHPNPPVPHLQPAPIFSDPLPSVDSPDRPQAPPGMPLIVIPIYSQIPNYQYQYPDMSYMGNKRRYKRHRNGKPFHKKFRRYRNVDIQRERDENSFSDERSHVDDRTSRMSLRRYRDNDAWRDYRDYYDFPEDRNFYMSQPRFHPDRTQRNRGDHDFFDNRSSHILLTRYRNDDTQRDKAEDSFADDKNLRVHLMPTPKPWEGARDVKVEVRAEDKYDDSNWIPNDFELTVRQEEKKEKERPQVPKIQYVDSNGKVIYEKKITEIEDKTISELKGKQLADMIEKEIRSIYSSGENNVSEDEPKFRLKNRRFYKNGNLVFQ